MSDLMNLFPLIFVIITVIVLIRGRLPKRVLITSISFGLIAVLTFTIPYFLWAVGLIPFRVHADRWALGLNILNFALGVFVIHWMLEQEKPTMQPDIPSEDIPRLV